MYIVHIYNNNRETFDLYERISMNEISLLTRTQNHWIVLVSLLKREEWCVVARHYLAT